MVRKHITTATLGALAAALCTAAPAAAYRVDTKTHEVALSSLADFDKCLEDLGGSDACLDGLRKFTKAHPNDAFEAGKRVRQNFNHWLALEFFAKAVTKKSAAQRCDDPDVKAAVLSALALPPDHPALASATALVREVCWEQLSPAVAAEVKGTTGYLHDNICPLLAEKGEQPAKCQATAKKSVPAKPSALQELKGVDWKKVSVDPNSGLLLRSGTGEELMLAFAKPGAHPFVLLKFRNVRGPWNQRVLLGLERNAGRGKDYVIAEGGKEWVAVTERDGIYQAYLKGGADGLWMHIVPPGDSSAKAPTRQEIAGEFASAAKTKK